MCQLVINLITSLSPVCRQLVASLSPVVASWCRQLSPVQLATTGVNWLSLDDSCVKKSCELLKLVLNANTFLFTMVCRVGSRNVQNCQLATYWRPTGDTLATSDLSSKAGSEEGMEWSHLRKISDLARISIILDRCWFLTRSHQIWWRQLRFAVGGGRWYFPPHLARSMFQYFKGVGHVLTKHHKFWKKLVISRLGITLLIEST